MPQATEPVPNLQAAKPKAPADYKDREAWFTASPDPWKEVARLQFGGDRTFATTVHRMIVHAERDQWPVVEKRLLQTLGDPEISEAGRQFVCRMLGLVGTEVCVPAVAKLLMNEPTADVARLTFDVLPVASVDEHYRAALGRLKGAPRAGLIGSIARRGDARAVDALAVIAVDANETAAIRALAERAIKKLNSTSTP
ncbi:MAG: hypothetical protein ABIV50_08310 [Opitutus sp.]